MFVQYNLRLIENVFLGWLNIEIESNFSDNAIYYSGQDWKDDELATKKTDFRRRDVYRNDKKGSRRLQ